LFVKQNVVNRKINPADAIFYVGAAIELPILDYINLRKLARHAN
jgi:hypothetical protein